MRKSRLRFVTPNNSCADPFYDIIEDYELIESSFAQQYGIRLRREMDMSWDEFLTLLCGINSDTPLGHIVSIRSEKNASRIKEFTPEQRKIRNEWLAKHKKINTNKEDYDRAMARLTSYFRTL